MARSVANIDVSGDINAILDSFSEEVGLCVEESVRETMKVMKKETKGTAPVDDGRWEKRGFPNNRKGKGHGTFKKKIAHKSTGKGFSFESTWYVKAPEYRLTHLLVHGHEQFIFGRDTGKRTEGSPFLQIARDHAEENLRNTLVQKVEALNQ